MTKAQRWEIVQKFLKNKPLKEGCVYVGTAKISDDFLKENEARAKEHAKKAAEFGRKKDKAYN